jgi:hypothetical protein
LRQPLEDVDARRSVRFGEHDVEPDRSRLIAIQQLGRQTGQLVARPGPASFALQAGLVDVDDDDLRIATIRQRQLESRVVRDRFELRQQRRLAELRQRMQQEDGEDQQPDEPARHADQPRGERPGCETHVQTG